jgi:hypothetical protein
VIAGRWPKLFGKRKSREVVLKKVLIILAVIALFIGFTKVKEWYDNNQADKARLLQKVLEQNKTIVEDSLTISSQTTTIINDKTIIGKQSKNIRDLSEKYDSTLDSYIKLEAKLDSIKADTIYMTVDSTDTNIVSFNGTLGDGWFEVYGKVRANPIQVFGLGMYQIFPIIIEVSLEKLPGGGYITYTHTNSSELEIATTPVKVIDKRRWIDRVGVIGAVSAIRFGAGIGLSYDNYGLTYMQYTDSPGLLFSYHKNLGELF